MRMPVRVLGWDDVEPLLEGVGALGTGGGGNPAWGRVIMERDLRQGLTYRIIPPEEVPDDAVVVSGGYMGSVKTLEEMGFEKVVEDWDRRFELLEALRAMEDLLGRRVEYVVPFELGGLNTPVMLSLAARAQVLVVDGDALGRAAPETQMTSFIGHGVRLTPMPLVDRMGNTVIVREAAYPAYADELGRWVVTRGGGTGANTHYPMTGAQLKRAVVPGTISLALSVGRAILESRAKKEDPVAAFCRVTGGTLLLRGTVVEVSGEDRGGFYVTWVTLEEAGSPTCSMRLVIKNETMAGWLNGRLVAVFPDLLCLLDPATGRGIMSVELAPGLPVCVVGVPCHPRLREALGTPEGAAAFSGARYGCPDLEYRPIEELLGNLG